MRVAFWTSLTVVVAFALLAADAEAQFRPGGRRRPGSTAPARETRKPSQPSPSAAPTPTSTALDLNGSEAEVVRTALRLEAGLRAQGKHAEADAVLAKVSQAFPNNLEIVEQAATRAKASGHWAQSVEWYQSALARSTDPKQRRRLLERLRDGALDSSDLVEALRYHEQLLEASEQDDAMNAAWARLLLTHRRLHEARTLILQLGERAAIHNREKATLYRDLARTELAMGLASQATSSLERAEAFVGKDAQLRFELDTLRVEAARMTGNLAVALPWLEARSPKTTPLRRLLATVYTETGQTERALALLRRTPELRGLLCQTLELAGKLEESLACQTEQVRRSPERLDLAIALADKLLQRRELDRARSVLVLAERNLRTSTHSMGLLADAWERLGEHPRASKLLERLQKTSSRTRANVRAFGLDNDDTNSTTLRLIETAEEEVETGNVEHALLLVEQYLEKSPRLPRHSTRAAKVLERAVVNGKTRNLDGYDKAERLWREIIDTPSVTDSERGTAIEHIVRNWTLQGKLEKRTDELAKRYAGTVPPLSQALWLAEAEYRREHVDRAIAILLTAVSTTSNPWPLLRRLEELAVVKTDYDAALNFAERRLLAPTASDRGSFATVVEYATKTLRPSQALAYAKRWTVAEPNRAAAWVSLAHRERQAAEWQASRQTLGHAYELEPNRFDTLFELATWYKEDGDSASAISLALKLLRADTDETRLIDAYQLTISLTSTTSMLLAVEQSLRVALGNAPRSLRLRDALLALYAQLLSKDTDLQKMDDNEDFVHRTSLVLIESLSDTRESTNEKALALLERLRPREATLPLFRFAIEHEASTLGRRALLVLGSLRAKDVLPHLIAWFESSQQRYQSTEIALAAFYCLAQYDDPRVTAIIRGLLDDASPELIAFSALTLASRNAPGVARKLEALLREPHSVPLVRAAATLALHQLEPKRDLAALLPAPTTRIEKLVLASILAAQPGTQTQARLADVLCDDAFGDNAFADAAAHLASDHRYDFAAARRAPENAFDPESWIVHLLQKPIPAQTRFDTLKHLFPTLKQACRRRILHDPEGARTLGRVFIGDGTTLHFGPLAPNTEQLPLTAQADLKALLMDWFSAISDAFSSYRTHADPELRAFALGLTALHGKEPMAMTAALGDPAPQIRENAIRWSSQYTNIEVLFALSQRVTEDALPRLRALAATRLGERGPEPLPRASVKALVQAARHDPFASVRRAALEALARDNPVAAKPELSYAESSDQEPELRTFARKLLESRP